MSHELVRDLIERVRLLEHLVGQLRSENRELREALRVATKKPCDEPTLWPRSGSRPRAPDSRAWQPLSGTPTGSCPVVGLGKAGLCETGDEMMFVITGNARS